MLGDVARIARSVRDVVGARAAIVSRVLDDVSLEVIEVVGEPTRDDLRGTHWLRADLEDLLEQSERLGRLHVTRREAVTYVEIPPDERPQVTDVGMLVAPLHTPGGELVGVLAVEGSVDLVHPPPGACELVELYADQARLALHAMREQGVLAERLRLSRATQTLTHDCAQQDDVAAMLATAAAGLLGTLRVSGAWACLEISPGVHADTAAYPGPIADLLGADICDLLDPLVDQCRHDGSTRTHLSSPVLARIGREAGYEQVLLAAIGRGDEPRGALLVLRPADDPPWNADETEALAGLARRLGTVGDHLVGRLRDQAVSDQLRELDQYRRDLVASITHDLKTPLTAIALNTELLEGDRRLVEAGHSSVAAIRRSAERLSRLVDDLMALARAEESGLSGRAQDVDVAEILGEALHHVEVEAHLRGITFDLDVPAPMPAKVDGDALVRVYANVVSNAVKFSLADGQVRLALRRDGDVVRLTCADDGIGIAPEDQAAVFDMFRRSADARARAVPGTGIGLAISRRIATRLGGTIELESTPGQGSTFTVRIPG